MRENEEEEELVTGTDTDTVVSETTIREPILTLASCAPDVWTSRQRALLLQQVNELIEQDPLARTVLSKWKGN